MKTKKIILTITTLFLLQISFAQTDQKNEKYLRYDGLVADLAICFDCDLDTILQTIKKRLTNYPINLKTTFHKEKGDTLIEIVSFNMNGQPDYSYYHNNLLKIRYSQADSNDFMLTIMNNFEMEQKQWIIHPKEFHVTDYDENSNMSHYYAEVYLDKLTKIEFEKVWKNGKFDLGQSKIYKKENSTWTLHKTEKVGQYDWPNSTIQKPDIEEDLDDEWRINTFIAWDSFENKKYLIENQDSITKDYGIKIGDDRTVISKPSFLPYKLKEGLETGNYKVFKKGYWKGYLLIDAKILGGKLHGVYNEYDWKTGKIKIYAIYKLGLLHGRRTIYFYKEKGDFTYKITELWSNGKYAGLVH